MKKLLLALYKKLEKEIKEGERVQVNPDLELKSYIEKGLIPESEKNNAKKS